MLSIISVIKGRPKSTIKAFNSIWENVNNPQDVEHLIALDCKAFSNDTQLHELMDEYAGFYKQLGINISIEQVCFCSNPDTYKYRNLHRDYWNPLAKQAKGDIIFGLTNDCIIQTKNFDEILFNSFEEHKEKYKHDIVQFLVDDDTTSAKAGTRPSTIINSDKWKTGSIDISQATQEAQNKTKNDFCQWVILSKKSVEIIGGIVPDEIQLESGDTYVDSIFKNTLLPSQLDLTSEIITQDNSNHTGRDNEDEILLDSHRPIPDGRAQIELSFIQSKRPYDAKVNLEILKQAYNINE